MLSQLTHQLRLAVPSWVSLQFSVLVPPPHPSPAAVAASLFVLSLWRSYRYGFEMVIDRYPFIVTIT